MSVYEHMFSVHNTPLLYVYTVCVLCVLCYIDLRMLTFSFIYSILVLRQSHGHMARDQLTMQ